ncbi:MAG: hypothetical protein ACYCT7_03890 [bacterium]
MMCLNLPASAIMLGQQVSVAAAATLSRQIMAMMLYSCGFMR